MTRVSARLLTLLAAAPLFLLNAPPRATAQNAPAAQSYIQIMKQAQRKALIEEPMKDRLERVERVNRTRRMESAGLRLRVPRVTGDESAARAIHDVIERVVPSRAAVGDFPPANARVNNPLLDSSLITGQAEQSVAAWNQYVLIGYNDGEGFNIASDTQGFSYSTDGGLTYTDGGVPAKLSTWTWTSDPQVVVDESTGEFYFAALIDIASTPGGAIVSNGIGVVKATFSGSTITWGTPRAVSVFLYPTVIDKEWLAADPLTHNLYMTYTKFASGSSEIDFTRSLDKDSTWSAPVKFSGTAENGLVQGSRVAVGPSGEVYFSWYTIGLVDADEYHIRKSTNAGLFPTPNVILATAYHAWANGAPGFNRGNSIDFPSMAVDHSPIGKSAHRGRVFVSWHEAVNFYGDTLYFGLGGKKSEVEPNNTPATATPFTLDQTLRGALTDGDADYFSFTGTQGQTVVFLVDSLNSSIDNPFRLYCSDGVTRLALSAFGPSSSGNFGGEIVYTLPANGTYYLRPASPAGTGSIGGYRIRTAAHRPVGTGRSRDHRDAFVIYSDNGTTWATPPVRVNDDPGWYDDWLPEVTVSQAGIPYVIWYDWRDAPASTCGGESNIYMSRSDDGGASWVSLGPITDARSQWTSVLSNIAPNQGDYLGVFANASAVWSAWADGRAGNPDVYSVRLDLALTPTEVSLVSAETAADRVTLLWYEAGDRVPATVYRRVPGGDWSTLDRVAPDGDGMVRYVDLDVTPGSRYDYRLGVFSDGVEKLVGEVSVEVPTSAQFALRGVSPNPSARDLHVAFSLAGSARATLELIDVTGRRIEKQDVGALGAGNHVFTLGRGSVLPAGVYLVRLTQGGRSLTTRAVVVR